jgi:hypothetical protein
LPQKSSLFLVLANIIPVLGTGKSIPVLGTDINHPCSWYWPKSSLFLVLAKIIPVLGRTGIIVASIKNRDDFCQYQEQE